MNKVIFMKVGLTLMVLDGKVFPDPNPLDKPNLNGLPLMNMVILAKVE